MSNPLVAGSVDTATPFSGAGLLDSGAQLADAISSGNWIEGVIGAVSVAVDTAATVVDPLGSLIGAGLGWLMDHFDPLKTWLNYFAGDAGEVAGFAQTWANIAEQMHGSGDELVRVLGDVDELAGEAMDAYRRFQADAAAHLHAAGSWAGAMGTGLQIASTIVQIIHDLVRDTIAQLVGSVISWAAEAVFTLGLATPVIVGQVTTRVASLSTRVGKYVTKVIDAIRALSRHLDELKALFRRLSDLVDKTLKGATPEVATPARVPTLPHTSHSLPAPVGESLSRAELDIMIENGYHSSLFDERIAGFYDAPDASLGLPNRDVWAMPTSDAAGIHTTAQAARETGMAQSVAEAHLRGGDVYAVHFPVDPTSLRRPTVSDSGGWEHFYPDPTSLDPIYGHTAVNTGGGAYLVNSTRETLVPGGSAVPQGAVLTKLSSGAWVVVRRY